MKWIDEVLEIALEKSPQVSTTTAAAVAAPPAESPKEPERRTGRRAVKPIQPH
ncbi:hypothetical protein D3C83_284440 [compost metagenome]